MKLACITLLTLITANAQDWKPLIADWTPTKFTGAGKATVTGGDIELAPGGPMTGVTWTGAFPQADYELRFEARKGAGGDFFASLTFPVGDAFATLVTGGWGGDIVGISSIDGWDASDNETRNYFTFEPGKWYRFRLEVRSDRLRVWIDDGAMVDVGIGGRELSLRRGEIHLSKPLGFASYNTAGSIRKVEYRLLRAKA